MVPRMQALELERSGLYEFLRGLTVGTAMCVRDFCTRLCAIVCAVLRLWRSGPSVGRALRWQSETDRGVCFPLFVCFFLGGLVQRFVTLL